MASLKNKALCLKMGVSNKDWGDLRRLCQVAKDRCVNPKNKHYKNYGHRGIKFDFCTGSDMAAWIIANIGIRQGTATLDRIDNNAG